MGPVKTGLSGEACDGLCDPDHPLSGGALSPACGVSLADVLLRYKCTSKITEQASTPNLGLFTRSFLF